MLHFEEKVKSKKKSTRKSKKKPQALAQSFPINFDNLEYFRDAYCFFSDTGNIVYRSYSFPSALGPGLRQTHTCTCSYYIKTNSCDHIKALRELYKSATVKNSLYNYQTLEKTHWYKIAKLLSEKDYCIVSSCKLEEDKESTIILYNNMLEPVIYYHGINTADMLRFKERFTSHEGRKPRGKVLNDLYTLFLSETEKRIIKSGYITPRLVFEQSIWFRFAYHLHNEFQDSVRFMVSADEDSQSFQLNGYIAKKLLFSCSLPENFKDIILKTLTGSILEELPENIKEVKGYTSYNLQLNNNGGIKVQPLLKVIGEDGIEKYHKVKHLPGHNHKIYINKIGLVDLQPMVDLPKTPISHASTVPAKDVPDFIKCCGSNFLCSDNHDIDPIIREYKIYEEPKEFHLKANGLKHDWCDFSINLPIGSSSIPLYDIIQQKQEKTRYLKVKKGWIDRYSKSFSTLSKNLDLITTDLTADDGIKLSRIEFLRFLSILPGDTTAASGEAKDKFNSFIQLKPIHTDFNLKNWNCNLRQYQEAGLHWLTFLAENNFGGLLCDDMGLGKTHQLMALMTLYVEKFNETKPFLVVCPTTVISHWQEKLAKFAPTLQTHIYHGQTRELNHDFKPGDIILTSYGIIRNDIQNLKKINFSIAVFDEIHYLKNKITHSYRAAKKLKFVTGFGLTGTPIENKLSELKSLMDIVLPGYLGSDLEFERNFIKPIEEYENKNIQYRLNKMISPFVLRRLKSGVLNELPPKIEDVRSCELSPEQVVLYRKTLATQGRNLQKQLKESTSSKDIPYLHIFALLGLLKQICNHPSLAAGTPENYLKHNSGKWNLFTEILTESLDSGNKVVVFTQFLGMIDIMERHLKDENINFVTLTGKSRNRGKIIKTFNEDDNCKVFLGSLKAGGTGIDLVAASVVIHYDRWWNAAKEDQATDRVHRIGQTRGVQVFKFVTKATLEEKISAIIDKKRKLMNSIVTEVSGSSLKIFTKAELYELLSTPLS